MAAVDGWLADRLAGEDPVMAAALRASADAGLPPHEVSVLQGRLLTVLARAVGARRVLEIGTLGGVSTLWLARGLAPGGRIVTLEAEPRFARVARASIARAGFAGAVDVRVGRALDLLPAVAGPFDLVFIDADKESSLEYLEWALRLARPGALIVADNVVRGGAVADGDSRDPRVRGVRALIERLGSDPRVEATALQTVGAKGHDGFAIAVVVQPAPATSAAAR
jgi:predicted O-methyltransferase YrrM